VPRGNTYSITATSNRDVRLFFAQARRVFEDAEGNVRFDEQPQALEAVPEEDEGEEEEQADEEEEEQEEEEE
jgi:hypothetical protein